MSSSISSSDPERLRGAHWRAFAQVLLGLAAGVILALLAVLVIVDPYDTGRPGLFKAGGVRPQGSRTAAASRGRDLAFDAAIIGNSHVQQLAPERMDGPSTASFVSLAVPGTLPQEQLVLLDWFVRNRPAPVAVVLGIDGFWCTDNPLLPPEKPFPFWLFETSFLAYARGLLRYDALEELPRRIGYLTTRQPERARPDGYTDYEQSYAATGKHLAPEGRAALATRPDIIAANATGQFPAAQRLLAALQRLPATTSVILLHPPAYVTALPRPGEPQMATETGCKAAFAAVAGQRARTAVIDWRRAIPDARDPDLWFDHTHYRLPLARQIEDSIAATLRALRS